MGTRVELHVFGAVDADCLTAARRAIEAVDDALTIHRPSPTTALNEVLADGGTAAIDDPILLDALGRAAHAVAATGGLFDPTAAVGVPGRWPALSIDLVAARIEARVPAALDFGGFGKGYALDRAADILRAGGAASALLSAGESSIAVIGSHPLGGGWPLAIPDPVEVGATLTVIEVEDAALSISATAGAGMLAPNRAATVRPRDGCAVTDARTAVAVETNGALAEAISTALIVADADEAAALIAASPGGRGLYHHAAATTAAREDVV
ncbi:ApbE family lipoprotein [Sphingomonas spermidinifaciens]|uniref:FAD:protein FMN transferase n=1 Tax=Sphingomonas spermidinifaciens TaxID=1141889 RepID=A0A2A4B9E4_9SPHN|nr:FAD:protein FMN transferase [Sphingomonas spermidinifaciens]PCD04286.1 ApbE family lipoprotein [Sphingomonas spermidinifaciens]